MGCEYDTDGDGDCARCARHGGCLNMDNKAVEIVNVVLSDLWGRAGFDEFWGEIQADVQNEIRATLIGKVERALNDS